MTDIENKTDALKIISMTQFEYELELDKARLKQKAIDDAESVNELIDAVHETAKRVRKAAINEACEWFGNYLMEIGCPDDWMRDSKVQSSGEQRFRKAMEEEV